MSLQADFDKAAQDAKDKVPEKASNDDKLALYGLFKQATVGDNDSNKPGFWDAKGRAKWDAWDKQRGKDKETAQKEYIELVAKLVEKSSTS